MTVSFHPAFKKTFSKIKDQETKDKIIKQIKKVVDNPELGKPMRHARKNTRELYVRSYRLSYAYIKEDQEIVILSFYHKDEQ